MTVVFESLLNNTFAHSRRRRTSDGQGGWAIDYPVQGTIAGRIRPASSSERETALQEEREISHVFYCLASVDIARGDHLTVNDLTVEVDAVREPSEAGEHYECDCIEVQLEENV